MGNVIYAYYFTQKTYNSKEKQKEILNKNLSKLDTIDSSNTYTIKSKLLLE